MNVSSQVTRNKSLTIQAHFPQPPQSHVFTSPSILTKSQVYTKPNLSQVLQIMMPHPPPSPSSPSLKPTSPQVSPSLNSARVPSPPGVKHTYPNQYQGDLHTKQTQMPDSGQTALQQSIPKTDSNSIPYPTRPIPTQNLLVTIASYLYSILFLAFAFSITMAVRERCKCSATLSHI